MDTRDQRSDDTDITGTQLAGADIHYGAVAKQQIEWLVTAGGSDGSRSHLWFDVITPHMLLPSRLAEEMLPIS
jgi:hypothetical protein